jgi:large repetitive protein
LTNVSGTLFFSADDGTHGSELWENNGSAAGTFLVQDINPGTSGSNPGYLTNFSGSLLFSANDGFRGDEPWILPVNTSTTTTVSSPNPSELSQAVIFTATVGAAPGASPIGTVDFRENSTDLTPGGVTLVGNLATFSTAALTLGSHTIVAIYSGDSNQSGSQGDDFASPQVVNRGTSATLLALAPNPSVFAQPVAFIAFVAAVGPAAGIPSGS